MHTKAVIETTYHPDWQKNRLKYVIDRLGEKYFHNKTVLELGPYNGYIGNAISELGAKVTAIEGRQSNADVVKINYPHINVVCANLDTRSWLWGHFDIIINFGVLYHIEKNHEPFLENCIYNSGLLLLESVIFDSDKAEIFEVQRDGPDQSLSGWDGTPTKSYVEDIIKTTGKSFECVSSSLLNGNGHRYDMPLTNSKIFNATQRLMWFVK